MNQAALLDALTFASARHSRQRRKDVDASPYINHPIAVARVLAVEGDVTDETMLIAAVLHDTIEDTKTTEDELRWLFGPEVAALVVELTDDMALSARERKRLQVLHAPQTSPAARQLKIADKVCNIRDVAASPPADWSAARKHEYLAWAAAVVDGCRGVNEKLDQVFDEALAEARAVLETNDPR